MKIHPVGFVWRKVDVLLEDGEVVRALAMVPQPRYDNVSKRQYDEGGEYILTPLELRSRASHNQFFAAVDDGFKNLPETIAHRWPTAEHLRKWLLIEVGLFDEKEFDCPDEDFATKLATFVRTEDEYARISIHRPTSNRDRWKVIIRRAKSQAEGAMKAGEFQESKKLVLELLDHMVGVEPGTLHREGGMSA